MLINIIQNAHTEIIIIIIIHAKIKLTLNIKNVAGGTLQEYELQQAVSVKCQPQTKLS